MTLAATLPLAVALLIALLGLTKRRPASDAARPAPA
jgi:hypothetical protein